MNNSASNKSKLPAVLLALGGGVILLAGLMYLFLTPKTYRASSRIKVIDWVHSRDLDQPSDLREIPAECELIRSNALLGQVIQNLGLADQWAKRYHPGTAAAAEETRARLLTKAFVHPVPNSSLIEILVTSDDREETAKIANEIAHVYTNYRHAQREELINSKLAGLKQQWEAEAQKIREAQSVLDDLYFQIAKTRATNKLQLYDADAYEQLLAKRIQLEGQYVARSDELARLAKMKPEELVQVLPSMDENSPLTAPLLQLTKAKTDLLKASLDHPADSPEVKGATYVVDTLEKKINALAVSTLEVKQTDLQGLSSALADVTQKIKTGSTNVAGVKIQDAKYQAALGTLNQLKEERGSLEKKMQDEESAEASRPTGLTAEIIDSAETPRKPFTPDGRVALGIIGGGFVLMLAGLVVLLAGQRAVKVPEKQTG